LLPQKVRKQAGLLNVRGEDEQEQCPIVTQRHPADHATWIAEHNVHVFIAWSVTSRLKGRDHVAQLLLKVTLGTEDQPTDLRMQSVGSHNEIKLAPISALQFYLNVTPIFMHAPDFVTKNYFSGYL
jgi:hypothetical protein